MIDAQPSPGDRRAVPEAPSYGADAKWASEAPSKKASSAGPLIAFDTHRRPVWTPRDYAGFAREGFMQNAIVYRCVRMIAECAATVPLLLYDGDIEIERHPIADLLRRPNPIEGGADLFQTFFGNLLVSGNAYLEAVAIDGVVREIHALRPDRMKVVPGPDGWPEAYDYTVGGRSVRIAGDVVPEARDDGRPGIRAVFHMRLYHPANDHYGFSPLEAAATAIDLHNAAARWNKALLDNAARPSGALVYTARDGNLTGEQYERLKSELEQGFQGAANAGRPLLLEGGLDWKSMSLSPKDMDFIEARHAAAREIALALGVPPMLLGIPGDNTYSNMAEATRSFWRQTVLPLVERTASALSLWLAPGYGSALRLVPDIDRLAALAPERESLWASLEKTTFLTTDEKRQLAGFPPLPPGASAAHFAAAPAQKFNPHHDALDRFTFGPGGEGTDFPVILAQLTDNEQYRVDLREEERAGGHTIARHVGETPEVLAARVRQTILDRSDPRMEDIRSGSFPSVEAASKLVDSTLAQNRAVVDLVASGRVHEARVDARFGSPTGIEAYARNVRAQPIIRETFGVGVFIRHDPASPRGYRVITAYPRNDR